ncbi:PTS system mannose/fructose/N-acetylgalactosamine-transporter subunit IIB [Caldibacillus thermoamylovorans]|uniref:PTS system, mannose-specific IIB component n=1 Tax=Caldibacillus thermoamylovorans TaxID=35841 RepID=A0ABD4AB61_9BACI|nr:PTS sugar transporter subunit IIB [Caldibacillus thermoamylovorans]KIO60565.1 PTS system, mannose-specific IIB component [Caldibacillus thermoamylovorans]KIO74342.1 PTS system, mannose-specific IIB component [Caldibacillus thermoamylovorans]
MVSENGIIHVRIDERLIHGQVATMWTNTLKASRIMIVDDQVVKNDMEKMALKLAVPSGIKLSILTASGAIKNISANKYVGQRVFLIVKSPSVLRTLVEGGINLTQITVGNMSSKTNSKQVRKSVSVTDQDIKDFKYLRSKNINIIAQMIPTDEPTNFMELI